MYNKDMNYTDHKVTIKTVSGTKNYLEGGKFKKVSLVGSDKLSNYTSKYSGNALTYYNTYTNYYGIYTSSEINNVLFAKVQADNEDLKDGDPYYFYKGSGAISSDIDLYFEGQGYLSVISKKKEGIETKGNLTFSGGTGDYYVFAEDDCLNTTTSSSGNTTVRNTLTIDVNSLTTIVDPEADEGDSIDSNGELVINGGTVVATGNMSDSISDSSKQDFIKLNFSSQQESGTLVCITDTKNSGMAFKSDRTFTTITLSSPDITKQTYYVYKGGAISGTENNGLYTKIDSYTLGTQQQWTNGNQINGNQLPEGNRENGQNMNPPAEEQNGNSNSDSNTSSSSGESADTTIAKVKLPHTGKNNMKIIFLVIVLLMVNSVVFYKKYKKDEDRPRPQKNFID